MKLLSKRILLIGAIVMATLGVMSCSKPPVYTAKNKAAQKAKNQKNHMLAQIKRAGVQVIQQGARLQMVLPIDKFFKSTTTQLKPKQTRTLQHIAIYLQTYIKHHTTRYPIKITAYTSTSYTPQQRQYLSDQYAQVIASYLWNHGFTTKQLSVIGHGSSHPIASNRTPQGSAYNRRVMIQVN